MRRRKDQHLGTLGDPLQWRISTPLTVDSVLRTLAEFDHNRVTAEPGGALATYDGVTRVEISPNLRRRVAPYLRLAREPGVQLVEISWLGRARIALATMMRRLTPRDEVPF